MALSDIPPVRADLTIPDDARCQEASVFSRDTYIPCGNPKVVAIIDSGDRRPYYMCLECAAHNLRNRGALLRAVLPGDAGGAELVKRHGLSTAPHARNVAR